LCLSHHFFFKARHGLLYWALIQQIIGPERWEWIKRVQADRKAYPMTLYDWQKIELALKQELGLLS